MPFNVVIDGSMSDFVKQSEMVMGVSFSKSTRSRGYVIVVSIQIVLEFFGFFETLR
jgi:hypothetical protein